MSETPNDIVNKIIEMANQISQQKHIANYVVVSPEMAKAFTDLTYRDTYKKFGDILV